MPKGDWLPPAPCVCRCTCVFMSAYRVEWRFGLSRIVTQRPCPKCELDFRIRRVDRVRAK